MKKYSIILPVKNGGEYVKLCINSILDQHLDNFNLIVLDNNSSDGTSEWISSLKDPRIVLHRSSESLSIEENWKRVLHVPKNEFMTLIGHDDILYPDFLEVIDDLINKYPLASLYHTHFSFIDGQGKTIRECKAMSEVETATDFLKSFLTNKIDIMGTGYMMRSSDYDRIGGIPDYPNLLFADFELWINLMKPSFKATSMQQCFSFRTHLSMTSSSSDLKMQQGFERFIYFLDSLKKEKQEFDNVISQFAIQFISIYCKGLSHRLLRTPINKRGKITVKSFMQKCKEYADMLVPGNDFDPSQITSVRLAELLDSSAITRNAFRLFKRIYNKPILK